MSGGKAANESGQSWEAWVKSFAQQHGFKILPYKKRQSLLPLGPTDRYVWTRAPYVTIYQSEKTPKANSEFVFETSHERIRIECKWQEGSGSVDEKYLFMYMNAVLTVPENVVIFAMGGDHFSENGRGREIRQWLENVCKKPPEWLSASAVKKWESKELVVLTPNTFAKWLRERIKAYASA